MPRLIANFFPDESNAVPAVSVSFGVSIVSPLLLSLPPSVAFATHTSAVKLGDGGDGGIAGEKFVKITGIDLLDFASLAVTVTVNVPIADVEEARKVKVLWKVGVPDNGEKAPLTPLGRPVIENVT